LFVCILCLVTNIACLYCPSCFSNVYCIIYLWLRLRYSLTYIVLSIFDCAFGIF
jgi:hypothetical protein